MKQESAECCPPFDPSPWDNREIVFENRRFLRDRVTSFLHIPLNFGSVMTRMVEKIEGAGAKSETMMVLSDDNSPWGSDVYVEIAGDVPDGRMETLSGTFLSRVYEGPFSRMGEWMRDMHGAVAKKGLTAQKLYTWYTTCPKCAKKYGKNHVVLLARLHP